MSGKQMRGCLAALSLAAVLGFTPALRADDAAPEATTAAAEPNAPREAAPAARVAHMRLSDAVLESPPSFSLAAWGSGGDYMTLQDWLHRLARARNDASIDAVALEIGLAPMSWAHAQELADAVARLNEKKPVYTYLTSGGSGSFLVAASGTDVAMPAVGMLAIPGVGVEALFFRGTLDRLGIEPQFVQIGDYKGAAEPLTRTRPSSAVRRQYDWLADDLYAQLVASMGKARCLKRRAVREAIDRGLLAAPDARRLGLVDRVLARHQWRAFVRKRAAAGGAGGCQWVEHYARKTAPAADLSNPFELLRVLLGRPAEPELPENTVAIVHADGVIVPGDSGEGILGGRWVGAATLAGVFDRLRDNARVKAVVFRVNSPGGSALASEMIHQAARRCAAVKPVIVSVSQLAASGGYYVACAGRAIVADPGAVVGSIGVVSGKLAVEGLFDKIGVTRYEVTRGRNAGMMMARPWSRSELKAMRRLSRRVYGTFVRRVREGRKGKIEDMSAVDAGRVFTGRQAVDNGLIDRVGGLRDAVALAEKAAGIKAQRVITLPRPRTLLDVLRGGGQARGGLAAAAPAALRPLGAEGALLARSCRRRGLGYLLHLAVLLEGECVLTAMPCALRITGP
jgi:protease-4